MVSKFLKFGLSAEFYQLLFFPNIILMHFLYLYPKF